MTSREKAKGTRFERRVADYLSEALGIETLRMIAGAANDKGDVWGLSVGGHPVTVECKNRARLELSRWVDEAARESANAGTCCGIVVHHRPGRGAKRFGDTYVTMTLDSLVELVRGGKDE